MRMRLKVKRALPGRVTELICVPEGRFGELCSSGYTAWALNDHWSIWIAERRCASSGGDSYRLPYAMCLRTSQRSVREEWLEVRGRRASVSIGLKETLQKRSCAARQNDEWESGEQGE
jgi:hypothetical protein